MCRHESDTVFAEATLGYAAVCLTVTNVATYGGAAIAVQLLLMGQREAAIALHRRKVESNFRLVELYPVR